MTTLEWQKCQSVTPGGKPFFYIAKVAEYGPENWGFYRIVWDRRVLAYAATKDQKYGDHPKLFGFYNSPAEAQTAIALAEGRDTDTEN